ncbi:MAG: alpha/beta fold hydrolase [Myxococcales bacterium]|nr:alpha/beta fold hydrolase [Myxococcota bacterium]MDW8281311.1 alpha/beta fold hydrolase [Myxococcales bacterium]
MHCPRILQALLLVLAMALPGCPTRLAEVCPRCVEVSPEHLLLLPADIERIYVLVPGILGYGWEWNGVQILLGRLPRTAVVVAEWDPWGSLASGAERVRAAVQRLLRHRPPQTHEVVLIGHSVGGLVLALAASRLQVPQGVRVRALTVGAPFAGTRFSLVEYEGSLRSPSPLGISGVFRRWPPPAPGVQLEVYPTTWPSDPLMRPRMGYDPGRLDVLPPGARLHALPPGMDHNLAVVWIAERLAREVHGTRTEKGS